MFEVIDELNEVGFYVNTIDFFISKNNSSKKFNTLEYFVIYIVFEKSKIIIENDSYVVEENRLVFIPPHTNFQCDTFYSENILLAFSTSFYERSANDSMILNSELFFNHNSIISISPLIVSRLEIEKFLLQKNDLKLRRGAEFLSAFAHNCVERLILDGLTMIEEPTTESINLNFSYLDVVNKFRLLLQKYYKEQKNVFFYSDKLSVSAQRLSIMTNVILGKGAKKIVVEKIVNEAVKMLKNSTLTISEISLELGFADEANFSTFIKKNFGKTPSEIRTDYIIMKKRQ